MKVLVTGISGLIGSAIGAHLRATGHEVFGLSRRAAGCANDIAAELGSEAFVEEVANRIPCCERIVHAGASLDKHLAAPSIALTNCLGTQQILALAARWGGIPVVYVSSVGVIGRPRMTPITENHPTAPASSYHASKLFGEHLMTLASEHGIPTASLRITAPIGPAMPAGRIVPVFIRRALDGQPIEVSGKGARRQDYVDVRDVACGVAACLAKPQMGTLLNIGSGRSISNLDLARLCVQLCSSRSQVCFSGAADPEESNSWDVSIGCARERIEYSPAYSLENSIRGIAEVYARGNS